MSERAAKVPCVSCGRWFEVTHRAQGWVCQICRQPTPPQPESTRESNPTADSRRIDAP